MDTSMKTRGAFSVAVLLCVVGQARADGYATPDEAAGRVLVGAAGLTGREQAALAVGLSPELAANGALGQSARVFSGTRSRDQAARAS